MLIGLISDTHVSQKRGALSPRILEDFENVDLIIHVGDITHQKVLDELEQSAPVIAVKGNNDKLDLNETETIEIGNLKIVINHGTRLSSDLGKLYDFAVENDADILITGHTHRPHLMVKNNVTFINPGSSNRPIKSDASIAILNINEKYSLISNINFINL